VKRPRCKYVREWILARPKISKSRLTRSANKKCKFKQHLSIPERSRVINDSFTLNDPGRLSRNNRPRNVAFANEEQSARWQDLQVRYWDRRMSQKSIFSVERTVSKHRTSSGTSISWGNFAWRHITLLLLTLVSDKCLVGEGCYIRRTVSIIYKNLVTQFDAFISIY